MNFAMDQITPPPRRPTPVVERHTVEHIVDVSPFVQILDVLVPQMVDQLVDFMKIHDTVTPEQVIAVHKISCLSPSSSRGSDCRVSVLLRRAER